MRRVPRLRGWTSPLFVLLLAAVAIGSAAQARPGGGSSFTSRSSSSSSRSSSSSSSSRSSSSSSSSRSSGSWSSGSSSRSSSSSSSSSSSGSSYGGGYVSGGNTYVPAGRPVGGGGGGGVALFGLLVIVGIGILVVFLVMRARAAGGRPTLEDTPPPNPFGRSNKDLLAAFDQLKSGDPDFSRVVFEDFLYALYAEAHGARDPRRLAELAPFLSPEARRALDTLHGGATSVSEFVIGSMRIDSLEFTDDGGHPTAELAVDYETNYTERGPAGEQSWLDLERWTLRRRVGARSRPPELARVFQCPSCGASLQGMSGRTCGSCRQVVDTGEFDWVVVGISSAGREARPPMLTSDVEERGTSRPTLADPHFVAQRDELLARDPEFELKALDARVQLIFDELQAAWSNRDWKRARPFVSDALFQMQLGYIEAYKRARLRNVTEGARIESMVPVKVATDRWYDAITVRVFAASLDYTISDDGKVVAGSRTALRRYSEYWTLIRGTGVKGRPRADKACPNCGAPLDVTMAGNCAYCSSRVGLGEFDWVLSRIEQDESYEG